MKNDKVFHILFQRVPELVFELIGEPPERSTQYEPYRSEEVKEKAYRLDGVLFPLVTWLPLYFVEIQARLDQLFYHRFFSEILLYLHHKSYMSHWRAVVIFWDKQAEPPRPSSLQFFFDSGMVKVLYLRPFLKNAPRTLWFNLLRLITASPKEAKPLAKEVGKQVPAPQEPEDEYIVQLIIGILLNKFQKLTRDEAMDLLDLGFDLKKTRFYHDLIEEGEAIGLTKGEAIGLTKGREQGETLGIAKGVLMLLTDRFGALPQPIIDHIMTADKDVLLSFYKKIWTLETPEDLFKI